MPSYRALFWPFTRPVTTALIETMAKNRPGSGQRTREGTNERKTVKPMDSWKSCRTGDMCAALEVHNCAKKKKSPRSFTLSSLSILPCGWTSCFRRSRDGEGGGVEAGAFMGNVCDQRDSSVWWMGRLHLVAVHVINIHARVWPLSLTRHIFHFWDVQGGLTIMLCTLH